METALIIIVTGLTVWAMGRASGRHLAKQREESAPDTAPDCLHSWGMWEPIAQGNLVDNKGARIGRYLQQQRTCTMCNMTDLDTRTT